LLYWQACGIFFIIASYLTRMYQGKSTAFSRCFWPCNGYSANTSISSAL
jgi:hypothetical protein